MSRMWQTVSILGLVLAIGVATWVGHAAGLLMTVSQ